MEPPSCSVHVIRVSFLSHHLLTHQDTSRKHADWGDAREKGNRWESDGSIEGWRRNGRNCVFLLFALFFFSVSIQTSRAVLPDDIIPWRYARMACRRHGGSQPLHDEDNMVSYLLLDGIRRRGEASKTAWFRVWKTRGNVDWLEGRRTKGIVFPRLRRKNSQ